MRYIYNESTDPTFNLAAEEWLLTKTDFDVFMLWRNIPAIIVGRNQNTLSQIDEAFVKERNIPVVRRLSGGGAVFHDLGNINFTFITNGALSDGVDFQRFTKPILKALQAMGVDCAFDGRNDLVIKGQKFSGNAQHFHKNRVLHHGTLLFASDITDISDALRVDPEKYKDKAVKSIRKRITNISRHLPEPMEVTEFIDVLMRSVSGEKGEEERGLAPQEIDAINRIADERYRSWDWNFGYSPIYNFTRKTRTPGGLVEVHLDVKKGIIQQVRFLGDYFGVRNIGELEEVLVGCRHDRTALEKRLSQISLHAYLHGVELPILLDCLF
ncbi:lipoate--protein ligase [Pseudodesulfovibrio sediminis]|uniref:lipoate--protein ligase n=1 Tax=Pseudodesulfovibrio sediminis TaxID=2810563 RepID=A0ABM7P2Y1_9BACT|nr:lipoate--protein ligase [Pseudodesulfovibrio sediminis]BCS87161.1 lipoate--protein ligase [Pseudodesulfovibrio sediminis]